MDAPLQPISPPPKKKQSVVVRLSNAVDTAMRGLFFRLGLFVAARPYRVIIASLFFLAITLVGMLRFRSESRENKLWVPTGTVAISNRDWVNANFGRFVRVSGIAFVAQSDTDLATKSAMLKMLNIAERGFNVTADPVNSKNSTVGPITLQQRCINTTDALGNRLCRTASPFNVFYSTDHIVKRADGTVNFFASVRAALDYMSDADIADVFANPPPRSSVDNSSFIPGELFAFDKGGARKVTVFRYTQLAENRAEDRDGAAVDDEADAWEEAWTKFLLGEDLQPVDNVKWYVDSSYGQGESLSEALSGDLPLLSFGFVLLGIYITFFLGDWHAVRSHRLLGLGALATAGLALGTCFGLSSALGMFFGPVHQILPLLIIGIGADDCFHITRAADGVFNRPDLADRSVGIKIALALAESGTAITVTSFTNVVVFLLSSISKLPALRFFALWAAIGILFAWVYAITFYTALVTLDFRRITARKLDCVPCLPPRKTVNERNWFKQPPGAFSRFFRHRFGPFIMRTPVRIVIIALFTAGLAASIYGCSQLYLKFRFAFFYPSGTSQREYQDVIDDYFKLGDPTNVYVRERNLSSVDSQKLLLNLCNSTSGVIKNDKWIQNTSVTCWFESMLSTYKPSGNASERGLYTPAEFLSRVKEFTSSGAGARYADDVVFNTAGTEVIGTRFAARYVYRKSNDDEISGLLSVREAADSVRFGDASDGNPAAFPYTFQDTFTEQYNALAGEIGLSLGLACAAVGLVCLILVGHPVVAAVCFAVVGIVIVGVLGLTYYSGINLNSVSTITLVLSCGIAVDFVVHIARAFLDHTGTRPERAVKALEQMGPPVFYAGFSTFLAIIVLAGARSYIFQVIFFGFFFLLVLSFLHGLVLGPVILSLIGPSSFYTSDDEKADAEKRLEERFVGSAFAQSNDAVGDVDGTEKAQGTEDDVAAMKV